MTDTAKSARDALLDVPKVNLCHEEADAIIAGLHASGFQIVATPAVGEVSEERLIWHYRTDPRAGNDHRRLDARRFVTLEHDGMIWVGIRAWHDVERRWYNGTEPETAKIKAWAFMPTPASGRHVSRGVFIADDAVPAEGIPKSDPITDEADRQLNQTIDAAFAAKARADAMEKGEA